MENIRLHIDSLASRDMVARLDAVSKKIMPNMIRGTLNDAAMDMKRETMPAEAKADFVNRQPKFWGATSRVDFAQRGAVDTMRAIMGFMATGSAANKGHAVQDLEQQEYGGDIDTRQFIPGNKARAGGSFNRNVKAAFRSNVIAGKKFIDADKVRSKTGKPLSAAQRWIRAVFRAKKEFGYADAYVMGNKSRRRGGQLAQTLSKVDNAFSSRVSEKTEINRTPLYTYSRGRKVKVAGKNFLKRAAQETSLKIPEFFFKQVQKTGIL